MEFKIQMEEASKISRKFTITVPAKVVANRFEKGLAEVQRTAKIKGFRPGHVPLTIVRQYYGEDVRHRVYHSLIDESYREALREHKVSAVGSPKVDAPESKTGEGEHDHALPENKDFIFTATVEILPEIEVKGYTGIALTKDSTEVTDKDVNDTIDNIRNSQAELNPITDDAHQVKKGNYADVNFDGGVVTETGVEAREGMKGTRVLEIGSNSMIPGFEDEVVGMKKGETKTFKIKFPKDYHAKDLASKEAQFTVTVNELKSKKLPEANDDFGKSMGYENFEDLKKNVRAHMEKDKVEETERKVRSELLQSLIEKNKFEVPQALIEAQTRALAQDWAQELKRQGFDDKMIQHAIGSELQNLKLRAENQVRSSLILESVAKQEKIEIKPEDFDAEVKKVAESMKVEIEKLQEFYAKDPGRKDDFVFRMRQERTVAFLLDKAKIKSKS